MNESCIMSTLFNYRVDSICDQHIKICLSGLAQVEHIESMYQDVVMLSEINQSSHILIDAISSELVYPISDLLPLMARLKQLLGTFKVARVCRVGEFRQELVEEASSKYGMQIRNFSQEQEALNWLTQDL